MMLKIKEFADFCGVTVKTLQLYDKIGVFHPALVDKKNGYRYYTVDQLEEFNAILHFRKLGFKLQEINNIKELGFSKDMLAKYLLRKKNEQLTQIQILQYSIANIDEIVTSFCSTDNEIEDDKLIAYLSYLQNENFEIDYSKILWL